MCLRNSLLGLLADAVVLPPMLPQVIAGLHASQHQSDLFVTPQPRMFSEQFPNVL